MVKLTRLLPLKLDQTVSLFVSTEGNVFSILFLKSCSSSSVAEFAKINSEK